MAREVCPFLEHVFVDGGKDRLGHEPGGPELLIEKLPLLVPDLPIYGDDNADGDEPDDKDEDPGM